MSEELVYRAGCGCTNDDVTGLLIHPCPTHSGKPATATDRLLAAAVPVSDNSRAYHYETHGGEFEPCRMTICIEALELIAAIRACWPAEGGPTTTTEGDMP